MTGLTGLPSDFVVKRDKGLQMLALIDATVIASRDSEDTPSEKLNQVILDCVAKIPREPDPVHRPTEAPPRRGQRATPLVGRRNIGLVGGAGTPLQEPCPSDETFVEAETLVITKLHEPASYPIPKGVQFCTAF